MVVITQSVLDAIAAYGQQTPTVEVCGVFVGEVRQYKGQACTYTDAIIEGRGSLHQAGAVTFTAETWTYIQKIMDEQYPDRKIVGWYHTHPGFGIFLSKMDLFIHEQFFNLPWQIAFVYDPIQKTRGLFTWQDGKALPDTFDIQDDTRHLRTMQKRRRLEYVTQWRKRLGVLLVVMLAVFLVAVSWLVVLPRLTHA